MLGGRRPWDGVAPHDVMVAVLNTPPPPVTTLHSSLAGRLAEVNAFLLRVLAKDRPARPADADTMFRELGAALFGAAVPSLAGAMPERPLEVVSSQSIELVLHSSPRGREDETEINPPDDRAETILFATQQRAKLAPTETARKSSFNDTVKQDAYDSSKIIVDPASDIPVFVSGGEAKVSTLPSGWYQPPMVEAVRRAADSQKATLPRATQELRPARRAAGAVLRWVLWLLTVALVAGVAFWLGRTLR
jgi:hypothetical protein